MKKYSLVLIIFLFSACHDQPANKKFGCGTCENEMKSQDTFTIKKNQGSLLFKKNCSACHRPDSRMSTGPGLQCATSRMPPGEWRYEWVRNSNKLIEKGDPYAVKIFNANYKIQQTIFRLTDQQIDSIFSWIDESYPCK